MYLNVSLTPPPSASEGGSCSTPKTPEILNSIISLTNPPLPPTYSHYQNQVGTGDLLSPVSSTCSPCEEVSATQFGLPIASSSGQNISSKTLGGQVPFSRPRTLSAGTLSSTGTPSPPVPELPSPVNTVEATKSALIKEGLKLQIKSKLKAAGLRPTEVFEDVKLVKEEQTLEDELTLEDEERRRRRRERNKVAATKCRNKKKERTLILLTESDVVEDQNVKLKTEIKRLEKERLHLEKLLSDPAHRSSCRHSCSKASSSTIPMVVVTPPDAPDAATTPPRASGLSPTSSSSSTAPCSSSDSTVVSSSSKAGHSGTSFCQSSYPAGTASCTYEIPYSIPSNPVIAHGQPSYDLSLPSSSKASDAYTSLSPPLVLPPESKAQTTCLTSSPYSSGQSVEGGVVAISSHSPQTLQTHPIDSDILSLHNGAKEQLSPNSSLVPIKYPVTPNKRYAPYQVIRHSNDVTIEYPFSKCTNEYDEKIKERDLEYYLPVTTEEEQIQGSLYMYPHQISGSERPYQDRGTNEAYRPIIKNKTQSRFAPYSYGGKTSNQPILTEIGDNYYQQGTCSESTTQLFTDSNQNHYYPQCNF